MKIAIDARVVSDKVHGISRYAYNLIIALSKIDHENEYILLSNNERLGDISDHKNNFQHLRCNIKLYSIEEQFLIPLILKKNHIDIYHSTTFSAPIYSPCKVIITIHDLIHLIYADQYSLLKNLYYKHIVKTAALKSSRIITVSENSKKDITYFMKVEDNKINRIYIGVDEIFFRQNDKKTKEKIKKKYSIPEDFVLYVGNEKNHKNAANVIKAFDLFINKYCLPYSLVLLGISRKYIEKVTKRHLSNYLISISHINNNDDIISLYQASSLLLCPSLYEGFGLPLLEGMACGLPIITSNNSSIPEVVGDSALMVDPNNIENISDEIMRALSDNKLRDILTERGGNRAKRFTWQKTAQKTLEVYKEVYSI